MNVPIQMTDAPLGFGPGGPLPAPSPWINYGGYIGYTLGGVVIGTPTGGNKGPGTVNAANFYINGVSVNPGDYLPVTGGTVAYLNVTGTLTIGNGSAINMNGAINGAIMDMGVY